MSVCLNVYAGSRKTEKKPIKTNLNITKWRLECEADTKRHMITGASYVRVERRRVLRAPGCSEEGPAGLESQNDVGHVYCQWRPHL